MSHTLPLLELSISRQPLLQSFYTKLLYRSQTLQIRIKSRIADLYAVSVLNIGLAVCG